MRRIVALIFVLLLATTALADTDTPQVPGSGLQATVERMDDLRRKMESKRSWLISFSGGLEHEGAGDARMRALISAAEKAGSGDALARLRPGSTYSFITQSGSLKDNAKEIYEFNEGQIWRYSTFGYAGTVHTWDFGSFPVVTKRVSLGQKYVTYIVDTQKKTFSVIDSALALNISGALSLAGQNTSISENQLNVILKKYYMAFYEPYGDLPDGMINSLLVDDDFRADFVKKDIPALISLAKKRNEQPW